MHIHVENSDREPLLHNKDDTLPLSDLYDNAQSFFPACTIGRYRERWILSTMQAVQQRAV